MKTTYEVLHEAGERDADDISALLTELRGSPVHVDSDSIGRAIASADMYLVARANARIIGMAVLYVLEAPHKCLGHVEMVAVDSRHRGQGIGKELMERIVRRARERGVMQLQLTSNATKPARAAAIRLYQGLGFTVPSTTLMRLRL